MTTLLRPTIVLLLGITLLFTFGCTSRRSMQQAHDAGVRYLVKHQNLDGSFGRFDSDRPLGNVYLDTLASHDAFTAATTALCVMALYEPGKTDPHAQAAMQKAVDYLLEIGNVGRASGQTFYGTWAQTYALRAMLMIHRDDRFAHQHDAIRSHIEKELAGIAADQNASGGWSYYDFGHSLVRPTGRIATTFNTASLLIAMHEAQQAGFAVEPDVIQGAMAMLALLRRPDGAYLYSFSHLYHPGGRPNVIEGSLARMQPCNLALFLYDHEAVGYEELERGMQYLRDYHHHLMIAKGRPRPHEAWFANSGYYFYYGHFYAGEILAHLHGDEKLDHADWLGNLMVDLQQNDDSWFDFHLYGYHRFYGTAYALLALQRCRDALMSPPRSAADAKGERYQPRGASATSPERERRVRTKRCE